MKISTKILKYNFVLLALVSLCMPLELSARKKEYGTGDVYEGDWHHRAPHGFGVMTYHTGDIYEGNWDRGVQTGIGTMKFSNGNVYSGNWANALPNGEGKMVYPNGSQYQGTWVDGIYNGQGTYTITEGVSYTGEWVDGLRNGKGTMHYSSGMTYSGEWFRDKRWGKGELRFSNGTIYVGDFVNEKREGEGTLTFTNGEQKSGTWKDDDFIAGKITSSNGSIYEGEIKDQLPNGKGVRTSGDGVDRFDGEWANGKFVSGEHFSNGQLYRKGTWANGVFTDGVQHSTFEENSTISAMVSTIKSSVITSADITYKNGDKYSGHVENKHKDGEGIYTFANSTISAIEGEWNYDMLMTGTGAGEAFFADDSEAKKFSFSIPRERTEDGKTQINITIYDGQEVEAEQSIVVEDNDAESIKSSINKFIQSYSKAPIIVENILTVDGVGELKFGLPLSELPTSIAGLYDRIEDDSYYDVLDDEQKHEYHFYLDSEMMVTFHHSGEDENPIVSCASIDSNRVKTSFGFSVGDPATVLEGIEGIEYHPESWSFFVGDYCIFIEKANTYKLTQDIESMQPTDKGTYIINNIGDYLKPISTIKSVDILSSYYRK